MTRGSGRPEPGSRGARLAAALLAVALSLPAAGGEREEKEAQLALLRERITGLKEQLARAREEYESGRRELAEIETRIGTTSRRLGELDAEVNQRGSHLADLEAERGGLAQEIEAERQALGAQIRAAYAMGRQDRLKLLLNQEEPARVSRMMVYYDYLHRERALRIAELAELHRKLDGVQQAQARESGAIAALRNEEAARQTQLESDRRARAELLLRLKAEIGSKDRELKALLADEKEVARLMARLGDLLKDIPADVGKPFRELRGRLSWPVAGTLAVEFGSPRAGGEMVWQGVVIGGQRGAPVRAVAPGRVAYAEWLRGYGLFLILDHGDGFMSLYGYNEALHRAVGEWVNGGEVIATLGDSGGQERPGLYFEIRDQGRPTDPTGWVRRVSR